MVWGGIQGWCGGVMGCGQLGLMGGWGSGWVGSKWSAEVVGDRLVGGVG